MYGQMFSATTLKIIVGWIKATTHKSTFCMRNTKGCVTRVETVEYYCFRRPMQTTFMYFVVISSTISIPSVQFIWSVDSKNGVTQTGSEDGRCCAFSFVGVCIIPRNKKPSTKSCKPVWTKVRVLVVSHGRTRFCCNKSFWTCVMSKS